MAAETQGVLAPYLSVVVTTRNDRHGGDPLKRLQAFVNTFAAQCRQTGLTAEVIVVEWNPPADCPRVYEQCRIPFSAPFAVRFVEVPAEIHQTFKYASVLPLFQMIAKNVGIRRARGRFILATNIDIVFSTELVEYLASGRLEPGRLYRADRHDIQADFPADGSLDERMAYCQTHQLRLHHRSGTHEVDPFGRARPLDMDVIGSPHVTLGKGWHVREGDSTDGVFRWATREAHFAVDLSAEPNLVRGSVLDVELAPNPYEPDSWVELEVLEGERRLARRRVSRRTSLRVALGEGIARYEIVMRVIDSSRGRQWLPLFESRDQLCYRVYRVSVGTSYSHGRGVRAAEPLHKQRGAHRRWSNAVPEFLLQPLRRLRSAVSSLDSGRVRELESRVASLIPSTDLTPLVRLLSDHRPVELHQNACGDFQLMARQHWRELRGYPELEMFSMSIDGLFEAVAHSAGITEYVFDMPLCIYHLEHEKGSGWSPEGEGLLKKRIADSGITWLDASTVHVWTTYMQWLNRPMIFNRSDWGLGEKVLPETTLQPIAHNV